MSRRPTTTFIALLFTLVPATTSCEVSSVGDLQSGSTGGPPFVDGASDNLRSVLSPGLSGGDPVADADPADDGPTGGSPPDELLPPEDGAPPESLEGGEPELTEGPRVIWFHDAMMNPASSLELALSSGMVTDVIVLAMHRADIDWHRSEVIGSIDLVRQSSARLIWCRDLWPYYNAGDVDLDDALGTAYYVEEIEQLRAEAQEMGADAIALDTEPYGYSLMKQYLKGSHEYSDEELAQWQAAVDGAVAAVGQVDYLLPAGSLNDRHPYRILATLSVNRIAENTYYANEALIDAIPYPYEVFGAHLNTDRANPAHPDLPYFLVEDLFGPWRERWSHLHGVFLYTNCWQSQDVAQALADYAAGELGG